MRFYFGSSSNLLRLLVNSPLREESLWRGKHYDPDKRHLHLKLANGLSGMSAPDIGRIAGDAHSWKTAASIYANCVKATTQGETAYLHAGFPFQGETDVVAVGMWLPFADEPRSNFLVFNLRSCSHPFPFASLTYDAGDRVIQKPNAGSDASSDTQTPKRGRSKKGESILEASDPGSGKSTRCFAFDHTFRFPDLKRKPVWRERIGAVASSDVMLKHADGSLEQVAFGEPEGSCPAGAIDACLGEPHAKALNVAPQKLPYFVRAGMALAMSLQPGGGEGITATLLLPFGVVEPVFMLPLVVDEDGVVDAVTCYSEPDGSHRQKRACFVSLCMEAAEVTKIAVVEGCRVAEQPQVLEVTDISILSLLAKLTSG